MTKIIDRLVGKERYLMWLVGGASALLVCCMFGMLYLLNFAVQDRIKSLENTQEQTQKDVTDITARVNDLDGRGLSSRGEPRTPAVAQPPVAPPATSVGTPRRPTAEATSPTGSGERAPTSRPPGSQGEGPVAPAPDVPGPTPRGPSETPSPVPAPPVGVQPPPAPVPTPVPSQPPVSVVVGPVAVAVDPAPVTNPILCPASALLPLVSPLCRP